VGWGVGRYVVDICCEITKGVKVSSSRRRVARVTGYSGAEHTGSHGRNIL
jgi:hypothetical protein